MEGSQDSGNLDALEAYPVAPLGDWPSPIDQLTLSEGGPKQVLNRCC